MSRDLPLYKKDKINLASGILARGLLLPINNYIGDAIISEAFRTAELKEDLSRFFTDYEEVLGHEKIVHIKKYIAISSELLNYDIALEKELIKEKAKEYVENPRMSTVNIIDRYEYITENIEDWNILHNDKIIRILRQQIKAIAANIDSILAIDPELTIARKFEEYPDEPHSHKVIQGFIEKDKIYEASIAVCRRIVPSSISRPLPLPKALIKDLLTKLYQRMIAWISIASDLSKKEKELVLSDSNRVLHFVMTLDEEEIGYRHVAFMLLYYCEFPVDFFQQPEYIGLLLGLTQKYEAVDYKEDLDFKLIIRMYSFIREHLDLLKQARPNAPEDLDFNFVKASTLLGLGKALSVLWEVDEALMCFDSLVAHGLNVDNSSWIEEGIFFSIDCCSSKLEYGKASELIHSVLYDNAAYWYLVDGVHLSEDLQVAISGIEHELFNKKLLTYDPVGREGCTKDYINISNELSDALSKGEFNQESLNDLRKKYFKHFQLDDIEDAAAIEYKRIKLAFDGLYFARYSIDAYESQIKVLERIEDKLSSPWSFLLALHKADLLLIKNDPKAYHQFMSLADQMKEHVGFEGMTGTSDWYVRIIGAHSLVIDQIEIPGDQIEKYAFAAMQSMLEAHLNSYSEKNAYQLAQVSIEDLLYSLLACHDNTSELSLQQSILSIIWRVLRIKNDYFNPLLNKRAIEIFDQKKYDEISGRIVEELIEIIKNRRKNGARIYQYINDLRGLEYMSSLMKIDLSIYQEPQSRSLLLSMLMKVNGKDVALLLSYKPGGHGNIQGEINPYYLVTSENLGAQIKRFLTMDKQALLVGQNNRGLNRPYTSQKVSDDLYAMISPELSSLLAPMFNVFLDQRIAELFGQNSTKVEDIDIYTDGILSLISLESIQITEKRRFGDDHRVNYVIKESGKGVIAAPRQAAIFYEVIPSLGMPDLTATYEEGRQISATLESLGVKVINCSAERSTKDQLEASVKDGAAWLHFALHGISLAGLPAESSALVLSPDGRTDNSSLLTYNDILAMDLYHVSLVVLSACDSSIGEISHGGPMKGLAYAFLHTGVDYVVASREKVDDEATARIMTRFYHHLIESLSPPDALYQTKLELANNDESVSARDLASWSVWS